MVGTSPTLLFSEYFGTLNLEKAAILSFPQGLPGFEKERQFAAVQIPGQHPLIYLQSVTTPGLCLLTFPVRTIDSNYCFEISLEERDVLQLSRADLPEYADSLLALAIVAVEPETGATANLAAPLIVNLQNNLALQSLQADTALPYSYPLTAIASAC